MYAWNTKKEKIVSILLKFFNKKNILNVKNFKKKIDIYIVNSTLLLKILY